MRKTVSFYAMTQKGYEVINFAVKSYREVIDHVVIGRDAALADDWSEAIHLVCEENGIPCTYREDSFEPVSDYVITVSWRWLIHIPSERLIVLHDSLLPRYRGFAPLVNALINGEGEIGVSAIFGAEQYDRGSLILQKGCPLQYPVSIQQAIELNNKNYLDVIDEVLAIIHRGETLPSVPQDEAAATYSIWRNEEDYQIDWSLPANLIRRFIDAVGYPYAGASTSDGEQTLIIDSAVEVADVVCELRDVGKVIFVEDGCPIVICGSGLLKIVSARLAAGDEAGSSYLPLKRFRTRFR